MTPQRYKRISVGVGAGVALVSIGLITGGVIGGAVGGVIGGAVVVTLVTLAGVVVSIGEACRREDTEADQPRAQPREPVRLTEIGGGWGWLRVSLGTMRRLLQACTSVDRLADYLLDRAVNKLPAAASARFAEEWRDHRQHYSGWRLVWWALCVRAVAPRTDVALGLPVRHPGDS